MARHVRSTFVAFLFLVLSHTAVSSVRQVALLCSPAPHPCTQQARLLHTSSADGDQGPAGGSGQRHRPARQFVQRGARLGTCTGLALPTHPQPADVPHARAPRARFVQAVAKLLANVFAGLSLDLATLGGTNATATSGRANGTAKAGATAAAAGDAFRFNLTGINATAIPNLMRLINVTTANGPAPGALRIGQAIQQALVQQQSAGNLLPLEVSLLGPLVHGVASRCACCVTAQRSKNHCSPVRLPLPACAERRRHRLGLPQPPLHLWHGRQYPAVCEPRGGRARPARPGALCFPRTAHRAARTRHVAADAGAFKRVLRAPCRSSPT